MAASVAELGMDITERVPRSVIEADLQTADVVILMKAGLQLPTTPRGEVLQWSFLNPEARDSEAVRPLREAVAAQIQDVLLPR